MKPLFYCATSVMTDIMKHDMSAYLQALPSAGVLNGIVLFYLTLGLNWPTNARARARIYLILSTSLLLILT